MGGSDSSRFGTSVVRLRRVLPIDDLATGLAPNTADEVLEEVQPVDEVSTTVLMVEQNAERGLAISDRGSVLDQGAVRFEDDADAPLEDDEVGRLYLGG